MYKAISYNGWSRAHGWVVCPYRMREAFLSPHPIIIYLNPQILCLLTAIVVPELFCFIFCFDIRNGFGIIL